MTAPRLTAAVVAGVQRERAQRVLDHLGRQTAADGMEIVIVDMAPPASPPLAPPADVPARVVAPTDVEGLGRAKAEAVRASRGDVVAFLEDHCYPEPGWAEALIDAHAGPWAAVGYAFRSANPDRYVSRSAFVSDYGLWAHPVRPGPATLLPGNNVSYKRSRLLALGDELQDLLVVDFNLHERLRRMGERLAMAPGAVAVHEDFPRWRHLAAANHHYCRLMACHRARRGSWTPARRAVYALAAPVYAPAVKVLRLLRSLRGRRSLWRETMAALPVVISTHAVAGVGESRGYLTPNPAAAERDFTRWEMEATRASGS